MLKISLFIAISSIAPWAAAAPPACAAESSTHVTPSLSAADGGAAAVLVSAGLPAAAKPQLSLAPGSYAGAQSVALADTTAGFVIHYTTDGTQPTAASPTYAGPIRVTSDKTIKAIATAPGHANSAAASATYRIAATGIVATPASLEFPVVNIGAKPVSQTVELKNTGSTPVTSLSVSLAGAGTSAYAKSQTCGATLPAGSSCTVTVTFGPKSGGDFAATLRVAGSGFKAAGVPLDGLCADVSAAAVDGNTYEFQTTQGNFYVALRPDAAPKNVANFLRYVANGTYSHTMIHRAVAGFVNQAGGYKYNGKVTTTSPTFPPVVGEMKLSNLRGTIAMARVGTDRNSATDQFFFNVKNNTALDTQDGGYTVFGQIVGVQGIEGATQAKGLAVMDAINADPIYNAGSPFDSIPLLHYTSGAIKTSNVVYVNAVTQVKPKTIAPKLPVFSIGTGTYKGPQSVSLTDSTPGATIYYYVLGSANPSPVKYTKPFTISKSRYIAAYAVAPGYPQASYVQYAKLTITGASATPGD